MSTPLPPPPERTDDVPWYQMLLVSAVLGVVLFLAGLWIIEQFDPPVDPEPLAADVAYESASESALLEADSARLYRLGYEDGLDSALARSLQANADHLRLLRITEESWRQRSAETAARRGPLAEQAARLDTAAAHYRQSLAR